MWVRGVGGTAVLKPPELGCRTGPLLWVAHAPRPHTHRRRLHCNRRKLTPTASASRDSAPRDLRLAFREQEKANTHMILEFLFLVFEIAHVHFFRLFV